MRRRTPVVTAAIAALLWAAPAPAATRAGSDLTREPVEGDAGCGGAADCTAVRDEPVTVAGVATLVWVRAGIAGETLRVDVVGSDGTRRGGTGEVVVAGGIEAFPVRIALRAGDRLAVTAAAGAFPAVLAAPGSGSTLFGDGAGGFVASSRELLVGADVEPDADGDAFGDETQDSCPVDATRQDACADLKLTAAGPSSAVVGDRVEHVFTVRNAGPSRVDDVVVRLAGVDRTLGAVQPGRTVAVTATVTAGEPGPIATLARASGGLPDPVPGDEEASVRTLFTGPSLAPEPVALPQQPCVNVFVGTRDDDLIDGTGFGDVLRGREGRDLLRGLAGDDCLEGSSGNDVLVGGPGDDRLNGGLGRDRLLGGPGRDRLRGGVGGDTLYGNEDADTIEPGRGSDLVFAGPGDDTIAARDGVRDRIDCGPGVDTVRADRRDRLRGCERIERR